MIEGYQKPDFSKLKKLIGGFSFVVLLIIFGIYFATGFYQIDPSEVGLVKRFGKFVRMDEPGINYHLPAPFESVTRVDVRSLRKIEIGFRTLSPGNYSYVQKEALMMTGDNNFASVESVVQYRVKDPIQFAFRVVEPDQIVKNVAESVIREQVAQRTIDEVLTTDRDLIALKAMERGQQILDQFETGIQIDNIRLQEVNPPDSVLAAFDDVNTAIQDKERTINTAMEYFNDVVPKAQGEASKTLQEASAYREISILNAQGEVARFEKILEKYKLAPEITRKRLYIETMEVILPDIPKIILPKETGALPLLDIQAIVEGGDSR
ncbi:MAG TPA: FtsH protease activity modulator HflK [Thermotogota bacterium]|nr:FtsH protease activity modulator HflK [Thermotogota bacterium]HRW91773.1 FtsH protease activity modulator HflK [Thermotogota bacterium]